MQRITSPGYAKVLVEYQEGAPDLLVECWPLSRMKERWSKAFAVNQMMVRVTFQHEDGGCFTRTRENPKWEPCEPWKED